MRQLAFVLALGLMGAGAPELKPRTLEAYERYVRLTDQRIQAEVAGTEPFLWLDRQPERDRAEALAQLRRGEIVVQKLETLDGTREIDIPDGMVHHWIGTVLIPETPLDDVLALVRDYERYDELFAPMIQRSRVLSHDGTRYTVAMRTYVKKVVTVVMDADYVIDYRRLSPTRVFASNIAANMYQVHDAGQPNERREPGDEASGYLWRFTMWCSFDQRGEDTFEQCESISLTRDVPLLVSWLVKPFVTGIPRETLEFTLGKVQSAAGAPR